MKSKLLMAEIAVCVSKVQNTLKFVNPNASSHTDSISISRVTVFQNVSEQGGLQQLEKSVF